MKRTRKDEHSERRKAMRLTNKCPSCGKQLISKRKMAEAILKAVGYPRKYVSQYGDGTLNAEQMFTIYSYLKKGAKK